MCQLQRLDTALPSKMLLIVAIDYEPIVLAICKHCSFEHVGSIFRPTDGFPDLKGNITRRGVTVTNSMHFALGHLLIPLLKPYNT